MTERFLRPVPDQPHSRDVDAEAEPLLRDLIGDVLRRTRLEQGRTLREVAEKAQVSLPYLSEVERGRKEFSSEILAAIGRALGLSMSDLTGMLHVDLTGKSTALIQTAGSFRHRGGGSGDHQAMLMAA